MDRWIPDIDHVTAEVRRITSGLTDADLNWQPAPAAWSLASILDHLMKVRDSYGPAISELRSAAFRPPITARIPGLPRFIGAMILRSVAPATERRVRTFPVWEPGPGKRRSPIVEEFAANQETLKALILGSGDLLARDAILSSPANRSIVYPLGMAFEIIVRHEERHLGQMARTVDRLRGTV